MVVKKKSSKKVVRAVRKKKMLKKKMKHFRPAGASSGCEELAWYHKNEGAFTRYSDWANKACINLNEVLDTIRQFSKKRTSKSTLELIGMIEGSLKNAKYKCEEIRTSIYYYAGGK
jgi:hypothetical protein